VQHLEAHSTTSVSLSTPLTVRIAVSRMPLTASALRCMASTSSQALVTMHRPVLRSASIDRPMQPSLCWTAGSILSRV
jgi:hypothetical protein